MKQIASPSVAMDIQSGRIETVDTETTGASLIGSKNVKSRVHTVISAAGVGRHDEHSSRYEYQKHDPRKDFKEVMSLMKDTKSVAEAFLTCMAHNKSMSMLETKAFGRDSF